MNYRKAFIRMESTDSGFELESQGSVITMGVMIGRTIASIMEQLPKPVNSAFRAAVVMGYEEGKKKEGAESAEDEALAGDS